MSRKRKTEDGGGSHEKMPRMNGHGGGDDSQEMVKDWEVRPGMIMEVKMRNFMCHQVKQLINSIFNYTYVIYYVININ